MKSSEHTLSSLIAIEGAQWHYHVPRFQREYVWKKNNWNKLLEDIYDNEPGHYMGSIICVHDRDELTPSAELIYDVVDGQQRLTTLSLLLCAIYKNLGKISKENNELLESEDFIVRRNSIKRRLIKTIVPQTNIRSQWGIFQSGSEYYCLRVQPSTQFNNLDDYKYILREINILPEGRRPNYLGNRRLYTAYKFFYQNISTDLMGLYNLLDRVNALSFIHILESTQAKAFVLFETLNYRGVPLSAIDIIKNKMLSTLESKHDISIDTAYDQWQDLLSYLPEDKDEVRFLRQFYNAFKNQSNIKVGNISRATGSSIITIYETLIKKDACFILEEMINKAKTYNQLIEAEKYPDNSFSEALLDLELIGAAPSYTFLLYLLSLPKQNMEDPGLIEKVINLLCKYYFRRNVTDFPGTRDLDSINIDLVDNCKQEIDKGNRLSFSFIKNLILTGKGKPITIGNFRNALANNLFFNNDFMARYALSKLNETYHTREYEPNLWQRNKNGLYVWTVEHIFPQGENIPDVWIHMVGNGNRRIAEKIQGEWVHCLGNLTLSGYNSKLSNASFEKKQAKTMVNVFGESINIGYKNGLALNNIPFVIDNKTVTLANANKWDLEHIKARNEVMVDMLISLFKFDDE